MKCRRWLSRLLAVTGLALQCAPAIAGAAGPEIEEIVVTALRRADSAGDVPVAITAFSSQKRDLLGLRSIQDFSNFTPGLSYSSSLDRISLRGIGRLTNAIGSDPGVATYSDGFYTASTVEASKTPLMVERVEILRGPQGTLYGRNSVGGAINVISKRPTDTLESEVRLLLDQVTGGIAEGYVSGPVTDGLSARLTLQYGPREIDATFDNRAGEDEGAPNRKYGELQLQYDFSDSTRGWLKVSGADWQDHSRNANLGTPYMTDRVMGDRALIPNAAFGHTTPNPGASDERELDINTRSSQDLDDSRIIVGQLSTELGGTVLSWLGGRQQAHFRFLSDLDYTSRTRVETSTGTLLGTYSYNPSYVQEYIEDKQYYSNEITLRNAEAGSVNWILGLYQYDEDFFQPVTWFQDADGSDTMSAAMISPINILGGGLAAPNPRRAFYAGSGDLQTESRAAFGQTDFEIAPDWRLTMGLRWSEDRKSGDERFRVVSWNPTRALPPCLGSGCGPFTPAIDVTSLVTGVGDGSGGVARSMQDSWAGWSGRFGVDWRATEDTLFYASYARGLKSGGFNLGSWSANAVVDEETVDAIELGLKSDLTRTLQLNLAAFAYRYENAQVPLFVNQGGVLLQNFFNIPENESLGLELEATWLPTEWLELRGVYGWLDATVSETDRLFDDENAAGNDPVDIQGNRTPMSSEHKLALSALTGIPVPVGAMLFAVNWSYRSDAYYGVFETGNYRAPSWDQLDLRLTWRSPDGRYVVIASARNVLDETGYDGVQATNGATSTGYGSIYSYTPPRSLGLELQARIR